MVKNIYLLLLIIFYLYIIISPASAQTIIPKADQRFGLGGNNSSMVYLGLNQVREWGQNYNASAVAALNSGAETYFVVGKLDDAHYTVLNGNLSDGHPKCKKSNTDPTIINCIDAPFTGIPNDQSYTGIATLTQNYKGQIWEISNEPDWGPYVLPEDYAVWFYLFAKEIHAHDPTAKIMNGGMVACCGVNVYETRIVPANSLIRQLDPSYANSGDRFQWIKRFRDKYKTLYGSYPTVNVWNIHPYEFTGGTYDPIAKKNNVVRYINEFITLLGTLPVDGTVKENSRPVYLTEFGILGSEGSIVRSQGCATHGCLTQAEQELEWQKIADFMSPLTDWLMQQTQVTKWYWFYWGPQYTWAGLNDCTNMDTLKEAQLSFLNDADVPNTLAIAYAKKAMSPVIFNPGFEAYDTYLMPYAFWFWIGGTGSDYWSKVVSDQKHSGNRSVQMHIGINAGTYGNVGVVNQIVPTAFYSGKYIKFNSWAKTDTLGYASLKITITDSAGQRNTAWQPSITTPQVLLNWTNIATNYVLVPSDTVRIEFEGVGNGANGNIWFDDFNTFLAGDYDLNYKVNAADLKTLISAWDSTNRNLTPDNKTNALDYAMASWNAR